MSILPRVLQPPSSRPHLPPSDMQSEPSLRISNKSKSSKSSKSSTSNKSITNNKNRDNIIKKNSKNYKYRYSQKFT